MRLPAVPQITWTPGGPYRHPPACTAQPTACESRQAWSPGLKAAPCSQAADRDHACRAPPCAAATTEFHRLPPPPPPPACSLVLRQPAPPCAAHLHHHRYQLPAQPTCTWAPGWRHSSWRSSRRGCTAAPPERTSRASRTWRITTAPTSTGEGSQGLGGKEGRAAMWVRVWRVGARNRQAGRKKIGWALLVCASLCRALLLPSPGPACCLTSLPPA